MLPGQQEGSKDVEITSIGLEPGVKPFVHEGGTVSLNIVVTNNGTEQETVTVSLRDDTEGVSIGSQQVTLAAGDSTTVTFTWDTTGATGGPAPPASPTPGTIHALTATATLDGDADESNNSMSLDPGIWVIAAPKPTEITFPENSDTPEAMATKGLASETPPVDTVAEPLEETFVVPELVRRDATLSSPPVSTAPATLSNIFRSAADSEEGLSLNKPAITTVGEPLWGTIRGRIMLQGRSSSLGSYVEIGGEITFADRGGYFLVQRPQGSFSLTASAPGYLSVTIPNLSLEPGETLALSPVRLRFGDADGNGVIDILDLTVAALNHGQVSETTSRP